MPTITVRQNGTGDHTVIQAAINASNAADVIEIQDSGVYNEALVPHGAGHALTIRVSVGSTPVLDGLGVLASGIRAVPGYIVEGLEIRNYTTDGINGNGGNATFTVRDTSVHDVGGHGIRQLTGASLVERVKIADTGDHGLTVNGNGPVLRNVLVIRPGVGKTGINAGGWTGFVDNCTVIGVNGVNSAGITSSAPTGVRNCIVTAGAAAGKGIDSWPVGNYNCVFGTFSVAAYVNGQQANDITADPQFIDTTADDYRLRQSTSPCVDTGVMIAGFTDDLAGITRPIGIEYDMGAYEAYLAGVNPADHSSARGWGAGGWGTEGWGGVASAISISNARATGANHVLVTISSPARNNSAWKVGDVLNPLTWIVTNQATGDALIVTSVRKRTVTQYVLHVIEPLAGTQTTYRVATTTLRSAIGHRVTAPRSTDFLGVKVPTRLEAAGGPTGLRDIANAPTPYNPVGGTLEIGSDGDYAGVSGAALARKLILRRLVTRPGEFMHLPDYGLGIREKEPIPAGDVVKLRAAVEAQVRLEPDVEAARAIVTLDAASGMLTVAIQARLRSGEDVPIVYEQDPNLVEL